MKSRRKKHNTVYAPLGVMGIDVDMVPLIQAMNSIEGVQTMYCCRGERNIDPYVLFHSDDSALIDIVRAADGLRGKLMRPYCTITVMWEKARGLLYRLEVQRSHIKDLAHAIMVVGGTVKKICTMNCGDKRCPVSLKLEKASKRIRRASR